MPGRVTATLEERVARYERMKALRDADWTYEAIGAAEKPPLGKERVRIILSHPPRPIGRPREVDRL